MPGIQESEVDYDTFSWFQMRNDHEFRRKRVPYTRDFNEVMLRRNSTKAWGECSRLPGEVANAQRYVRRSDVDNDTSSIY